MNVRERPPLRLGVRVTTPSGRRHRWRGDSPNAEDVPQGLTFSSTIPGGHEQCSCKLARKPGLDYSDLERLSTITVEGVGGVAWEGRLERAPSSSGREMSISPNAVGWQAALDDNKAVQALYVDRDLSRWGPASVQRRINVEATYRSVDASIVPDASTGAPSLNTQVSGPWGAAPGQPLCEAFYDAGPGVHVGSLYYAWKRCAQIDPLDANWRWQASLSDDDVETTVDGTTNLRGSGPFAGTVDATGPRRFAFVQLNNGNGPGGDDNVDYAIYWTCLATFGDHGLTKRGEANDTDAQGLYVSDIVRHAVQTFTRLKTTRFGQDTVELDPTVVNHLAMLDPTTCSEIVRQANRFTLNDWAVWDDLTFHYYSRGGGPSKLWQARVAASGLEETGPQVDRLWDSIVVQYNDVTGKTRTVGPVGSGADTEDESLSDPDPYNPAKLAGVTRRDLLSIGTATPAGAIDVGRRFLEQSKLLDTSGSATITGYVLDNHGVVHPAWAMRAGDYVSFVDARDRGYRRIARASYDDGSKGCSLDLDSPPEGLQALLEQLSAALVPLGLQ